MIMPHVKVMKERKFLGPIFLIKTVDGNWNTMYVVKNTRVIIEYRFSIVSLKSLVMPAMAAADKFVRSIKDMQYLCKISHCHCS